MATTETPMLEDVGRWAAAFLRPTVLVEFAALAACLGLAWLLVSLLQRGLHRGDPRSILFGTRIVDGALFPLALLCLAYVARTVLLQWVPLAVFKVPVPVLVLCWDKVAKTGFLNSNRMPLRQHEDVMVFYKSLPTYNPQMVKCEPHKRNHSKGNMKHPRKNSCYGNFIETPTIITDEKFPTSIVSILKEHETGKFHHPTQKPVALMEYLIKTYTNEGETVLDNCMGSGTTGVAAKKTGRTFIGIEKDDTYFELAVKRIESA